MKREVTILTGEPTIEVIADMRLREAGILNMAEWVKQHRPDCVPEAGFTNIWDLLPHDRTDKEHGHYSGLTEHEAAIAYGGARKLTDNEVLVEFAGRKCYDSFAEKAGKKTNFDYLDHIFSMDPIHSSILYHAKMSFFFAGVSRKFSHQFIRNYVGSDREEEGSPSQESTRFTHHYGWYVAPPYVVDEGPAAIEAFRRSSQANYEDYVQFITNATDIYKTKYGKAPTGPHRKDIFEAGAGYLSMSAETSFIWTTNPMAVMKFLRERCHDAADAEIFRFSKKLARICFEEWKNFFIGAGMAPVRKELER